MHGLEDYGLQGYGLQDCCVLCSERIVFFAIDLHLPDSRAQVGNASQHTQVRPRVGVRQRLEISKMSPVKAQGVSKKKSHKSY
jgi:hypothetical protein